VSTARAKAVADDLARARTADNAADKRACEQALADVLRAMAPLLSLPSPNLDRGLPYAVTTYVKCALPASKLYVLEEVQELAGAAVR
jgi:hypothetical protein